MKKNKSIDLTSGPILKTLAELALPIMAFGWLCNRALEREVARMDDSDEIAS